jgi:hypothetical protein
MSNVSTSLVDINTTATGRITDNDTTQVTIGDVAVAEGGTVTFTLTLGNAVQGGFSLDVAAAAATALGGGVDYNGGGVTPISFTGTAGQTRTFTLTTVNDNIVEPDEIFSVLMSNVSKAGINISDTATAVITDNDVATVSIAASVPTASEPATNGQFRLTLSKASSTDTVVTYMVSGSASAADHSLTPGSITIPAGATTATINVPVIDDALAEANETVIVTMQSLTGDPQVTLAAVRSATVTIVDDEIGVSIAKVRDGVEPSTSGQFRVTLNRVSTTATLVTYTVGGTAGAGDHTLTNGTVTIPAGATSALINVPVIDNLISEPIETVVVQMTGLSGNPKLVYNGTTSASLNIIDNDPPKLVVSAAGQTVTLTEGQSDTFTVVFEGAPPTVNVTVTVIPSSAEINLGAGAGQPIQLLFTPSNANTPQVVTITVVDDTIANGNRTGSVRFLTASSQASFNGLVIPSVVVNIINDDVSTTSGPASLEELIAPESNNFRSMGEPNSIFAGYGGPNTLRSWDDYFPTSAYGQIGTFFDANGLEQTLIPVFSGVSPLGWGTQVTILDASGATIATVSPGMSNSGAWMVALPGINLVNAVRVQVVVTAPKTAYEGVQGSPDAAESLTYGANISGLFEDLSGLFESGLLRDQGDILGQLLSSSSL